MTLPLFCPAERNILMLKHILSSCFLALSLAVGFQPSAAHAENGVRDGGSFFSSSAKDQAGRVIADIHNRMKKDVLVETFADLPADVQQGVNLQDKAAAGQMMDQWARKLAGQHHVNGVYILLVRNPAKLQVEVGNETAKKAFTTQDRDTLVTTMLAKLRQKQDDDALLTGVRFVDSIMASHLPVVRPAGPAAPTYPGTHNSPANSPASTSSGGHGWLAILLVIIVIFVVLRIIRGIFGGGGGYAGGGYPPGGGYGPGGYGPGGMPMGGGGGGFFSNMMGGIFGAAAGNWLYDRFSGRDGPHYPGSSDGGYNGGGGGDFGGGGGDFGGGGDSGGGGGDF